MKNHQTSTAMLADKIANVKSTKAEILTALADYCASCTSAAACPASARESASCTRRDPRGHATRPGKPLTRRRSGEPDMSPDTHAARTAPNGWSPSRPPHPRNPSNGAPPSEGAAARTLRNTQMRRNLTHATTTIRNKRAIRVAEMPDWEQPGLAGLRSRTVR